MERMIRQLFYISFYVFVVRFDVRLTMWSPDAGTAPQGGRGGGAAAPPPTLNAGALFQPAGQGMDGMLSGCAERSLLGRAVEMTSGVGNQAKGVLLKVLPPR